MSSVPARTSRRDYSRLRAGLPWIAGVVLIVGVVTSVIAFDLFGIRNTAHVSRPIPGSEAATPPPSKRKTVPAPKQALQTIIRFLDTAVARKHLAESYALTAPVLRQGMSLAEWETGNIPVTPYPVWNKGAGNSPYQVQWSYRNEVMVQVLLSPNKGSKIKPQTFWVGAKLIGEKWRVWYFAPRWFAPVPAVNY